MLDQAEVQYDELKRKKLTVEKDKAKIINVIQELDRKKEQELRFEFRSRGFCGHIISL